MSYYLIFSGDHFECYTKDKKVFKEYLKQRDISRDNVMILKDLPEKIKEDILYYELYELCDGIYITQSEEEFIYQSLYHIETETRFRIDELRKMMKYLRLKDNEKKFLLLLIRKINDIFENEEEMEYGSEVYDMPKFIRRVLRQFSYKYTDDEER